MSELSVNTVTENRINGVNCPFCNSPRISVYMNGESDPFREIVYPFTFYLCANCLVRFQLYSPEEAKKLYSDIQESAVRHTQSARKEMRYEEEIINLFARFQTRIKILDIGSGDGWLLKVAHDADSDCTGIDVSEKFAEIATNRSGVQVRVGTLHECNFGASEFNSINLDVVLMYVPEPIALFKEISRILEPGGILRVHEYDPESIAAKFSGKSYWMYSPTHLAVIPRRTLKLLARSAGLDLIKTIAGTEASLDSWLNTRRKTTSLSIVKDCIIFFLRKIRIGNLALGADTAYIFKKRST